MTVNLESTPLGTYPPFDLPTLTTRRARVIDAGLRPAFLAEGPARERLDQLFDDGALCVTTGQQPGLLTGPLFTIYKALTTVALARSLERTANRPVVPVFWVGGDDHDFAETNHVYLLTMANEINRLSLRERGHDAPSLPLYREVLGPQVDEVIAAHRTHTPETEFRPDVLEWVTRHYRAGCDFATAFAGAIADIMGPYGIVVFRPTHVAAKRAMAPFLLRTLEQGADLDDALATRAAELESAGKPVPVPVGDGATPVMIEGTLGRDRLLLDGDSFVARRSGGVWTLAELGEVAQTDPERLSPNVLSRPVMEAALLPTLAYVAGPGELRYLPQSQPLYDRLDVFPQVPFPRWSGRVIETRVTKVLDKYGISADDLRAQEGQLEASLVRADMPAEATHAMTVLRRALGTEYQRLREAAERVDPTLRKPVQAAQNNALSGVADIEKRIVTHLKKQNDIVVQQLAKARHNLFPLGKPQERVFNVVAYLIRYGPAFLDKVLETIETSLQSLDADSGGS